MNKNVTKGKLKTFVLYSYLLHLITAVTLGALTVPVAFHTRIVTKRSVTQLGNCCKTKYSMPVTFLSQQ